ncbi:hypothetical protein PVK06_032271 [Gossypium arboreum]|uniref:Uncharacterized protein n=1 Tax=Gossypium arboreum TaxID=29729 RepID=A0ABR0NTG4_GOSAR|nr:hypothetical protein PVK06_032271 [Gossypium arboreum]
MPPQKQARVEVSKNKILRGKRARFYIIRRCVFMLLCWRDHGDKNNRNKRNKRGRHRRINGPPPTLAKWGAIGTGKRLFYTLKNELRLNILISKYIFLE